MRGKPNRNKNKILVALVALFTMLMCTSVGFAAWITTGGSSGSANGNIEADDYEDIPSGEDANCITNLKINNFRYSQGNGFVDENNGKYVSSASISGIFAFEVAEAKTAIASLRNNQQFSLKLELTTSATSNFTYGTPTFTGFTNSPVSKTTTSSATVYAAYNITLTSAEYAKTSINCGFSISVSFTGTLSNFPSLESATYSLAITPGEAIV